MPYRTSYYAPAWGFCLAQEKLDALPEGEYDVVIDSTLADGSLTYGEHVVPGRVTDEVIVSCHVCHPSLANDNLAGIAVAISLAQQLAVTQPHYTYRFLFMPGTIGSITWLAQNASADREGPSWARARLRGRPGLVDVQEVPPRRRRDRPRGAARSGLGEPRVVDFSPFGYDERQYSSPGFNLPSAASPDAVRGFPSTTRPPTTWISSARGRGGHARALLDAFGVLDRNRRYVNLSPYGEPQLGKRGLYDSLGGRSDAKQAQMAMLWVLNLSDGEHSLLDIAERAGLPFGIVDVAARALHDAGLVKE